MANLGNSTLLEEVLAQAKKYCDEYNCSGLNRDYIIIAAAVILKQRLAKNSSDQECKKALKLLEHLSLEEKSLRQVLAGRQGEKVSMSENLILTLRRNSAVSAAKNANQELLTLDLYLAAIMSEETPGIKSIHKGQEGHAAATPPAPEKAKGGEADKSEQKPAGQVQQKQEEKAADKPRKDEARTIDEIVKETKDLQEKLQDKVLGQWYAVNAFVTGYFQSELHAMIAEERKGPRGTFLFAGPPGVGKTFLSEEAAGILGIPFMRLDMSEYADETSVGMLTGYDKNFKNPKAGKLTDFVNSNKRCIVLFDEIEKSCIEVIHLFLQILDSGFAKDEWSQKMVDFSNAILIFTTNAGKNMYEQSKGENLSLIPKDAIMDALGKDVNPRTHEPFFPAAICSRFAAGVVVMFNYLDAFTLDQLVQRRLDLHVENMRKVTGVDVRMSDDVSTAILLAEGASADARAVQSRANLFFGTELYELYRLAVSQSADTIKTIRVDVDVSGGTNVTRKLFIPEERLRMLANIGDKKLTLNTQDIGIPEVIYTKSLEEATEMIDQEDIHMVLCDLFADESESDKHFLNHEDMPSPARDFLMHMLANYPGVPVILAERRNQTFSKEEKVSYYRRGVRGFLNLDGEDIEEQLKGFTSMIFRNQTMTELGRSNQRLRYETAQCLSEGGASADITLFDLSLEKAVKAEDKENVLSMLSTPKDTFDDVIGAEDAIRELKFFVNYMNNPRKFRREGAAAPKGILLYGPPGTGKTMLARAFANESKATFIATEGNRFFVKWIGDSPAMVHKIFATARRYAPAVIFIDEIDVIGKARSGGDTASDQVREEVLTALFAEMDGFSKNPNKPVFVLAATNYGVDQDKRMAMDEALMRRFDRKIMIDLPSLENRRKFLENKIRDSKLFRVSDEAIASLADRSAGMSLALLGNMLDMAVRNALQNGLDCVTDEALDEAFETFNSGDAKKRSPEAILRTARHEAGHALISYLSGQKPSYLTIVSRSNFGGYMQYSDEERTGYTRQELLARIRTALGGRAAELVYYGEEDGMSTGASEDLATATRIAERMLCYYGMDETFGLAVSDPRSPMMGPRIREEVNKMLRDQMEEAEGLIRENKAKIERLVDALLKQNKLKKEEIDKALSE